MRYELLVAIQKGLREVGVYDIDIDHISEAVRRHVEPLLNKAKADLDEEAQNTLTAEQRYKEALEWIVRYARRICSQCHPAGRTNDCLDCTLAAGRALAALEGYTIVVEQETIQ